MYKRVKAVFVKTAELGRKHREYNAQNATIERGQSYKHTQTLICNLFCIDSMSSAVTRSITPVSRQA